MTFSVARGRFYRSDFDRVAHGVVPLQPCFQDMVISLRRLEILTSKLRNYIYHIEIGYAVDFARSNAWIQVQIGQRQAGHSDLPPSLCALITLCHLTVLHERVLLRHGSDACGSGHLFPLNLASMSLR